MPEEKRDVHVVPNYQSGQLNWSVIREKAKRSSGVYQNKADAMEAARKIAINNRLERVEHRKDGVIVGKDSYGNDPRRIRG